MCGLVEGIKDIGRSIDDGIHSLGRGVDDAVHGVADFAKNNLAAFGGGPFGSLQGLGYAVMGMGGIPGMGGAGGLTSLFGGPAGAANPYAGMGFYGFGPGGGEAGSSGGSFLSSIFGGSGGSGSNATLSGVGDLLRGGFGLYQANQLKQAAKPSAINQQAEGQLQALMADPSSVTKLPGYEAGLEAMQRGMAAGGFLGSGNMATALQKYGGDFYNNAIGQYANLSQLGRGNEANYRMGSIQLAGQALNSLGYGGLKLFGK